MSIHSQTHPAGFKNFTLSHGDGVAVVSAFGGQLLSWTVGGTPILFENAERAISDGKTPYRGGAPICFSSFGMGSLLPLGTTVTPQHGHARTTVWDASVQDDSLVLTTTQPSPEGYGPTSFYCELTYRLSELLSIRALIRNVGDTSAPFQFAVHAYWACSDPTEAMVEGLGNRYLDNLLGLTEQTEPDSSMPHVPPVDRVYLDADEHLRVLTDRYRLQISCQGGSGGVLWNPGPNHTLKDLGSPDFICVEVGQIAPGKTLEPGEEHVIEMICQATPS